MILESDLHNESDPVRSTRAEGRKPETRQARVREGYTIRPGALSELFSFCLRAQLHSTARERIISEGEQRHDLYPRWPPENLSSSSLSQGSQPHLLLPAAECRRRHRDV